MKKVFLVLVLGMVVFVTGCTNDKKNNYEVILKEYADEYFETYAAPYLKETSKDGKEIFMMDIYEVTVGNIRNVNRNGGGNFDLTKIKACTDESRVDLLIDRDTSTITQYEYYLDCE